MWEPGSSGRKAGAARVEALAGEAEQPLLIWTEDKNLEYICGAKRFNCRQAS